MRPPVSAGPVAGGTRPAGRHRSRRGQFAERRHHSTPPKCPRGRRQRPVPSRLLPGVENIPSCDRAPAAPGGEDPPRSPPAPGRAPAPVPPLPGGIQPRDSHGGSRWGRRRRKCPAGSGRAPTTKAGNEAAGTPGRGGCASKPPASAPRPHPGSLCVLSASIPREARDFTGGHGGITAALWGGDGAPFWGAVLVASCWWGSASWESACPPGPLAQGCLASPRLCPGFLRLRGIGMSRGGRADFS